MDKYQEMLINDISKFYVIAEDQNNEFYNAFVSEDITLRQFNQMVTDVKSKTYRKDIKIGDVIDIEQLENINICKYFLLIYNKCFENVVYSNNKVTKNMISKSGEGVTCYGIQLDFNHPIDNIKISFKLDLADSITIPLNFIKSDGKAYYEKIQKDNLLKKLNTSHSYGQDLITIKFQNCNDDVCKTKIVLYDENKQIMGEFEVDKGMFYKSITNLAYGKYFYKISQFDKDNNLIIESDIIEFNIRKPNYSGKGLVRPWG